MPKRIVAALTLVLIITIVAASSLLIVPMLMWMLLDNPISFAVQSLAKAISE